MAIYKSPKFYIHLFVALFSVILFLAPLIASDWPKFCVKHFWAFFMTSGVIISLMTISMIMLFGLVLWETYHWLFYFFIFIFFGVLCLASGGAFIHDSVSGCSVNEDPFVRERSDDDEEKKSSTDCPLDYFLSLLPDEDGNFPIVFEMELMKRVQNGSVAYFVMISLTCLGVWFVFFSVYFLKRRGSA